MCKISGNVDGVAVEMSLADARLMAVYFKEPIKDLGGLGNGIQTKLPELLEAAARNTKDGIVRVEFSLSDDQEKAGLFMMRMVGKIVADSFMEEAGMFQSVLETIKMVEGPIQGTACPDFPAGDFAAVVFWLENGQLPGHYGPETIEALKKKLNDATTGKSAHEIVGPKFGLSSDQDIDCLKLMVLATKEIARIFQNASLSTMEAVKDGVAIGKIKDLKIFIG